MFPLALVPQLSCIEMEEVVVGRWFGGGGATTVCTTTIPFPPVRPGRHCSFPLCLYSSFSLSPIDLKMQHCYECWTGVGRTSRHKIIARMSPLQSSEAFYCMCQTQRLGSVTAVRSTSCAFFCYCSFWGRSYSKNRRAFLELRGNDLKCERITTSRQHQYMSLSPLISTV